MSKTIVLKVLDLPEQIIIQDNIQSLEIPIELGNGYSKILTFKWNYEVDNENRQIWKLFEIR